MSPLFMPHTLNIAENVFVSFLSWVYNLVAGIFEMFSISYAEKLKPDLTRFLTVFPVLGTLYEAIVYFALGLLILIFLFQLLKAFGGKIIEAEDPKILLVRTSIFAFLIVYAKDIIELTLDIAIVPFNLLKDVTLTTTEVAQTMKMFVKGDNSVLSFINLILKNATLNIGGLGPLIAALLLIILLWRYIKLLAELVERYVVMGVLALTSPLAFALGASKSTSDVFRNWCRMYGSQLFVIVMNIWFIRGFASGVASLVTSFMGSTGLMDFLIAYLMLLSFLKIGSKLDEYLSQLGLHTAKTGGGPLSGLGAMMALRPIMRAVSGSFKGAGGGKTGSGFGAASKVIGGSGSSISSKIGSAFSGATYAGNVMNGTHNGMPGVIGSALNTVTAAQIAKNGIGGISGIQGISDFLNTTTARNAVGGAAALKDAQSFMPSLFNKPGISFSAGSQLNTAGKMEGKFTTADGKSYSMVATSMRTNNAPEGAYGIMRGVDGSGFYVQAMDSDGNISKEGTAALFGAGAVSTGDGIASSENFNNSFFPGQEEKTDGLTFGNVDGDEFSLTATDADGNEMMFRSAVGYEMPDDYNGLTLTDSNGQSWFIDGMTAQDTEMLSDGVSLGSDGSVIGSDGSVIGADVLNTIGDGYGYDTSDGGESLKSDLFAGNEGVTDGLTFSNDVNDVNSLIGTAEDGSMYRFSIAGEGTDVSNAIDEMAMEDKYGNSWVATPYTPDVDGGIGTEASPFETFGGQATAMAVEDDNALPEGTYFRSADANDSNLYKLNENGSLDTYSPIDSVTDNDGTNYYKANEDGSLAQAGEGNVSMLSYSGQGGEGYEGYSFYQTQDGSLISQDGDGNWHSYTTDASAPGITADNYLEDNNGNKYYENTGAVSEDVTGITGQPTAIGINDSSLPEGTYFRSSDASDNNIYKLGEDGSLETYSPGNVQTLDYNDGITVSDGSEYFHSETPGNLAQADSVNVFSQISGDNNFSGTDTDGYSFYQTQDGALVSQDSDGNWHSYTTDASAPGISTGDYLEDNQGNRYYENTGAASGDVSDMTSQPMAIGVNDSSLPEGTYFRSSDASDNNIYKLGEDGKFETYSPGNAQIAGYSDTITASDGTSYYHSETPGNLAQADSVNVLNQPENSNYSGTDTTGYSFYKTQDGGLVAQDKDGNWHSYTTDISEAGSNANSVSDSNLNMYYEKTPHTEPNYGSESVGTKAMPNSYVGDGAENYSFYESKNGGLVAQDSEGNWHSYSTDRSSAVADGMQVSDGKGNTYYETSANSNNMPLVPTAQNSFSGVPADCKVYQNPNDSSTVFSQDSKGNWTAYSSAGEAIPFAKTITGSDGTVYSEKQSLANKYNAPGENTSNSATRNSGGVFNAPSNGALTQTEIAQREKIERSNSTAASFFGVDRGKIHYTDTSRKKDGIITVHNKDGSATMFVSDKSRYGVNGEYKSVKSSDGQTWYAINGSRTFEKRNTGKIDENGRPIKTETPTTRFSGRISPKKQTGNRFSILSPRKNRNNRK